MIESSNASAANLSSKKTDKTAVIISWMHFILHQGDIFDIQPPLVLEKGEFHLHNISF